MEKTSLIAYDSSEEIPRKISFNLNEKSQNKLQISTTNVDRLSSPLTLNLDQTPNMIKNKSLEISSNSSSKSKDQITIIQE